MALTDQETKDFTEAFEVFDKEKNGSLDSEELGAVMRSLGQNPTDGDIKEIVAKVEKGGKVDLKATLEAGKIMKGKMAGQDLKAETLSAFAAFDKDNNGTIATA